MNLADTPLLRELCLIDGQWLPANDGATTPVTNPATGGAIAHVPTMGAAETPARRESVLLSSVSSHKPPILVESRIKLLRLLMVAFRQRL